jgi:hypothetical protein
MDPPTLYYLVFSTSRDQKKERTADGMEEEKNIN